MNSVLPVWISLNKRRSERKETQVGEVKDGHHNKRELISVDESKQLLENIVELADSSY